MSKDRPESDTPSITAQMEKWSGAFGREYTERNNFSVEELDANYVKWYGVSRTQMAEKMLAGVSRDIRILEVGCNVGMALRGLQKMGFRNLYGVELQSYAVEQAKSLCENINIIQGSAFDIPFKDQYFDLVFTSGVLIHIDPANLGAVCAEIHRCSSRYIWGFEYYSEAFTEIDYRGNGALMWKGDYANFYLQKFSDLSLVRREFLPYLEGTNVDCGYLLEKIAR